MKSHRTIRTLSVVASAALILGAFVAGPADAKKKKKKPKPPPPVASCPAVTPAEPASSSTQKGEALEAPVVTITDAATADAPHVFEYSHGQAIYDLHEQLGEDTAFFNIQVDSANPDALLFVRQEWAPGPASDFDLYLYDAASGEEVESSGSPNLPMPVGPIPEVGETGWETGAWGYESISDFPVLDCAAFTIESRAYLTRGEDMQLKVWLAPPA
jgi:hypothetical protein